MQSRDIVIQIRLPRLGWKPWVGLFAALVVLGGALAWADVMWTPFAAGEKLSSAKMNANFKAMADAINVLQAAPAGKLPHLILNQGNVDLGIYLGSVKAAQGASAYPLVFSSTFKAPLVLSLASGVVYDGPNCTGNIFILPIDGAIQPVYTPATSNFAVDTILGTVFQTAGPLQAINAQSANFGQCQVYPANVSGFPAKDTKVPNMILTPGTQTSIQMM